jgi:hypothetical protein
MSGKRMIWGIASLVAFVVAVVGSVTLVRTTKSAEPFLTTTSPKGTYTVRLTGRKDRPRIPFVEHGVRFSVTKGEKPFLADKFLHSGDWLDPSFELWYPENSWLTENILQFYKREFRSDGAQESIVVLNKTAETILFLRIASVDTFLLFDVQPGTASTLAVSAPRTDSRWASVEAELSGHRAIKSAEKGFVVAAGQKGPFVYYIYVKEDGISIESPDLQKSK